MSKSLLLFLQGSVIDYWGSQPNSIFEPSALRLFDCNQPHWVYILQENWKTESRWWCIATDRTTPTAKLNLMKLDEMSLDSRHQVQLLETMVLVQKKRRLPKGNCKQGSASAGSVHQADEIVSFTPHMRATPHIHEGHPKKGQFKRAHLYHAWVNKPNEKW